MENSEKVLEIYQDSREYDTQQIFSLTVSWKNSACSKWMDSSSYFGLVYDYVLDQVNAFVWK